MKKSCEYYFIAQSPFSYLGHARFTDMTTRLGIEVDVKPCDMNAVIKAGGGLPVAQRPAQRKAYRLRELDRWGTFLDVPLNLQPAHFPVPVEAASRLIIAAKIAHGAQAALAVSGAVMRAVWAEERNIADPDTLAVLASGCGLDGPAVLAQSRHAHILALYDRYTQDAIDAQAFGAPWYVVDGEGFWGQDRLDFVQRALEESAQQ